MKKFYLLALCAMLFAASGFAQQLSPTAEGGFELGNTFGLNGWTPVNNVARQWFVGTAAGTQGGTNAAYTGTATVNNGVNAASVQHFYRDIVIPAGATNVLLNFYLKETVSDNTFDYFYVFTTTTANTPIAGTLPGAGYTQRFVNTAAAYASFTLIGPINLTALAGTTVRLVFTLKSDGASPHANPAVDNISLTYTAACTNTAITTQPASAVGVCQNGSASISVAASGGPLTYQWMKGAVAVVDGGGISGATTSTITFNPAAVANSGSYTVVVTSTGCNTVTSTASVVTVTAGPTAYTVGGSGGYCIGSPGQDVTLSNSQTGIDYQLLKNGTNFGATIPGTGAALDFGIQTAGTYTVTANNSVSGCSSTMNGSAVVVQNPLPQGNIVGNNACAGGTPGMFTFTSSAGTGPFIITYNDGVNPNVVKTNVTSGTPFNVSPNPSTTTIYNIVSIQDANGCIRSAGFASGSTATITVNPLPTVTGSTDGARCGTGTVNLSATASAGATIDWYTTATGGTLLLSGSTTYSPTVSGTTNFYAEARNTSTGCTSAARTQVTATVNSLPGTPTGATGAAVCGSGSATISATVPGGITIDWYAAASGGTVLAGGSGTTSYTTPVISTTTTYYAEARNTTTGCISAARLAVTVTVNPLPQGSFAGNAACAGGTPGMITFTASVGSAPFTVTYNDGVNPDVVKTGVVSGTPFNVVPNPAGTTVYTIVSVQGNFGCTRTTGFTGGSSVTVTVNPLPTVATTTPNSRCGTGTVTLGATASAGATIDWFTTLTGGTAVATGTTYTTPSLTTTTTYYAEARNTATGCMSAARTAVVATINAIPAVPTGATGGSVCGSGTVNISATVPGGITIDWYAAATGGTVLAGGTGTTTFTTPVISTTTSYFAEARNTTTGCISASRLSVTATVNALPQGSFTGNTVCAGGTGTLTWTATAGTGPYSITYNPGAVIKTGAVSGTAFNASPNPAATTAYPLVSVTDANGCVRTTGFTSGTATITVNPLPTVASVVPGSRCGTGTVNLSATGSANATIDWYAAATGGTALFTGTATGLNTVTTGSISVTTTYYTQARNLATGCISSARTPVVATVNPNPTVYTVTGGGAYCIGGTGLPVGLSGSEAASTYQLYNGATPVGGAVTGTGSALAFGNQTAAGTYTVIATRTSGGCTLTMTGSAVVSVHNPVISTVTASNTNFCLNGSTTLTAAPVNTYNQTLFSEGFEGASTFSVVNIGTTTAGTQWTLRSSPYTYGGNTFNDGSQFMLANSDAGGVFGSTSTTLVSPTVSTLNYSSLSFTYNIYFRRSGDNVYVQVSTDGGTTWTQVKNHNATVGTLTAFAPQTIDLSAYINNPSLQVRFDYESNYGYYVALDDIALTGNYSDRYSWTSTPNGGLPASAATPLSTNNIVVATPTAAGPVTYTATLVDNIGCTAPTKNVSITVKPIPVITTQPVGKGGCIGDTLSLTTTATGVGATYQWYNGATALVNSAHINGANTAILTIDSLVATDQSSNYYLLIMNSNGCTVSTDTVGIAVNLAITITSQPVDRAVCAGANTTFSVSATGGLFTYQWRKGAVDIVDVPGHISGSTTKTLTITGAVPADAAGDYNVAITGNCIAPEVSDYVSLTVNQAAVTPTTQASFILFPSVNPTSVTVSFNPSPDATNYLIVVKSNATPPSAAFPADGTTYTAGTGSLTGTNGRIDYVGTNPYVSSNGLSPNVMYYYYIYAYNVGVCGTKTKYLTPYLTGSVTTGTNASCGTPIATLYWAGTGSVITDNPSPTSDFNTALNWSTAPSTWGTSTSIHIVPSGCNDVVIALKGNVTITLSANDSINNLTYTLANNTFAQDRTAILSVEGKRLVVNGDALIDAPTTSGIGATDIKIGENNSALKGYLDFKANVSIGPSNAAGLSYLLGHVGTKITFRGDLVLGKGAAIAGGGGGTNITTKSASTPDTVEFDGPGLQQVTWNNNYYYDNFINVVVGNQNNPVVRHVTGTFVPDNILNSLTINGSSVLDLAQSQWNRAVAGGTFTMKGTSRLVLGNDKSISDGGQGGQYMSGSNFPGGFTTISLSPTSTIEYNGDNTITQTVYTLPSSYPYGNLALTNAGGAGNALKISTGLVTVSDTTIIDTLTTFTPGANVVSNGKGFIKAGGTLNLAAARIVSGAGEFNAKRNGNLILYNLQGISAAPAMTGAIITTARNFDSSNITYIGAGAQISGNGLPYYLNKLTINNASGVTMYASGRNYTVGDSLIMPTGALVLNGDSITINKLKRTSGTFTGSATSSIGIVSNYNVPLFFTAGAKILKDIFLTTNATAIIPVGQRLDIAAGATPGSVTVGAGAVFTTRDSLALKSDALGTARVGPIPQDASGNALGTITGNVNVERYFPARRSWRLLTAPVSTTRTIYNEWQVGGKPATLSPNSGTYITSPTGGNGLDVSVHYSMMTFDPTIGTYGSFVNVANTKVAISNNARTLNVPDNIGYFTFVRGDRTPSLLNAYPTTNANITTLRDTGVLQTGMKTFGPLANGRFMLIGNPYASPVNFAGLTRSNVSRKFWAWDPRINNYLGAFVLVDGQVGPGFIVTPSQGVSTGQDQYIESSQAVFVQASGASGTVTFNESAKAVVNNNTVFRPAAPQDDTIDVSQNLRSNLYLDEGDTAILADGTYQQFNNSFSAGFDQLDGLKFINLLENFGIVADKQILILERRPLVKDVDTIFFKLWNTTQRNYQLRFTSSNLNHPGLEGYLVDSYLKTETKIDLNGSSTIGFSINGDAASKATNRFMIVFRTVAGGPLPVTFTSVKAYLQNKSINVEWNVTNEIRAKSYDIERSTDGTTFTKAGSVAATGNNNSTVNYQWPDASVNAGTTYYYRIRSIGTDGKISYSNVVKVTLENGVPHIFVYPNPIIAGDDINIHFLNQPAGKFGMRLLDKLGQLIATKQVSVSGTNVIQKLPFGKALAHGNYQLEITKPDGTKVNIALLY